MELRELRYFLAIAQSGSISGAAEKLYMTQPSLSRQMQNLEREVGGALFERGSRRIKLTERGKLLKKRAEEMLELYEKTIADVSTPEHDISGEVRIGGGETPAMKSVIRAALNIERAHPKVKFKFFSGDAVSVLEKLDKGLIDFGVIIDAENTDGYNALRLPLSDAWGALTKSDCKLAAKPFITPADLEGLPLICSDQSFAKGLIARWLGKDADEIAIAATYNLLFVASQLVEEGAGVALCLDGIINTEGSGLTFRRLEPQILTHIDVMWKKYALFSKPAELFLAELKKECAPQ